MELTAKYQYSYFLYPYIVDVEKYDKYILKLLKDKNCKLKIFEKEKDLEIYSYFNSNIRNSYFPTFEIRDENLKKLQEMNNDKKSEFLSKHACVCFDYDIGNNVQGKIGKEDGIFFNISKVEIICFNTGICFISLKTHIAESESFEDLLNFNYKFRDINSEFNNLKKYENIKIQTDIFKDVKEISDLIKDITGENKKKMPISNNIFYTFSYACIASENWDERNDFSNFENEFTKFACVNPSNYITDLNKESQEQNLSIISKLKYARTGITKLSCNLLCSTVDMYNYTKLPYEYETVIYYTYILRLYQKIFLNKINGEFKSYEKIVKIRKQFIKFTKTLWAKEITNDDTGSLYYRILKDTLEIDELYEEIKKKYEIVYKDLNIEKNNRDNIIIVMLLILSLILNTFTIISYLYIL